MKKKTKILLCHKSIFLAAFKSVGKTAFGRADSMSFKLLSENRKCFRIAEAEGFVLIKRSIVIPCAFSF